MITKPPNSYDLCGQASQLHVYSPRLNTHLAYCLNRFLIVKALVGIVVVASSIQDAHLHDGEGDAAEADGRLEGGHGLGVGQPVQARLVHLQQQVALLQQNEGLTFSVQPHKWFQVELELYHGNVMVTIL